MKTAAGKAVVRHFESILAFDGLYKWSPHARKQLKTKKTAEIHFAASTFSLELAPALAKAVEFFTSSTAFHL